jgi:hypothetical protein
MRKGNSELLWLHTVLVRSWCKSWPTSYTCSATENNIDIRNQSFYIPIFYPQTCIKLLMGITNDSPMFELEFWENNEMEIKSRYEILWINGSEISRSFLFILYTSFVFLREQSISIPDLCKLISIKPRWSSMSRQHNEYFYIFYYSLITTSQWRILLDADIQGGEFIHSLNNY